MSALYQRARPIRWEDVIGQEHVKDVLRSALAQGRVGHAYLLSGPRGVGKTTIARLIAMTANCTGAGPKPCGECESCLAVRSGNHPDVLEIDAASNNSVDDVRDLREKVGLAAMRGGKKIYILDEAHMMSRAAFNALLKTLEEPPGHVIFILATTEPEKIIPTILSRCQHYRFRRLTPEEIASKLTGLVTQEGATADPDALQLIGRLADGAMRDGESLLERMLAAGSAITRPAVEDALGLPPSERVRGIAGALVLGDAGAAIAGAAQLYRDGFAARTVVEGLVAAFGAALHAELGLDDAGRLEGAEIPRLLKLQAALDEQESRFVRSADQQSLELALTHALLAAEGGAAVPGVGSAPAASVPADLLQRLNRMEKELSSLRASGAAVVDARPAAPAGSVAEFEPAARRGSAPAREAVADAGPASIPLGGTWADVQRQASMQLRAFLKPAQTHAEAGYVSLSYGDKNSFHAKQIASKFDEVAWLVLRVFGPVTFELIAPEGVGRRQKLGGAAVGMTAAAPVDPVAPRPAAGDLAVEATRPAPPAPAAEIPDFEPVARRATPPAEVAQLATSPAANEGPRGSGTGFEGAGTVQTDLVEAQASEPVPVPRAPTTPPPRRPVQSNPVQSNPVQSNPVQATAPRQASAAPEHRVDPPSPDDMAAAPLPDDPFMPWEEEHVADAPPAPADAQGGDLVTPPGQDRELYIVEAVTQEPDLNDIGGSLGALEAGPPNLDDAPFAEYSVERPQSRPQPAPRPAPSARTDAAPAPSRPGDIRAHPMYEEVKGRFSGRVREIGKNRNYQARGEATEDDGADTGDALEA